jgi:hypothetical protein
MDLLVFYQHHQYQYYYYYYVRSTINIIINITLINFLRLFLIFPFIVMFIQFKPQ